MSLHRLLVVGGSGFIGAEICRVASLWGMPVTGLSRHFQGPSGFNKWSGYWPKEIEWVQCDILNEPDRIYECVQNAESVIDCVGASKLTRRHAGRSLAEVNCDSACLLADMASDAGVSSFVFLSAGDHFRGSPEALEHKRRAEEHILGKQSMSTYVLRPDLVWGWGRWTSVARATYSTLARQFGSQHQPCEVNVQDVSVCAAHIVRNTLDCGLYKILDAQGIQKYAKEVADKVKEDEDN